MKIPTLSTKQHNILENIVKKARALSGQAYQKGTDGFFHLSAPKQIVSSWLSLTDAFQDAIRHDRFIYTAIERSNHDEITERINEQGLSGFHLLGEGSNALTMALKSDELPDLFALRINVSRGVISENLRSLAPHLLQSDQHIELTSLLEANLMHCVAMFELSDSECEVFQQFLYELYRDTCFEVDVFADDDHAVLPNGIIVFVDPGAIKYVEKFYDWSENKQEESISNSFQIILSRAQEWGLAEELIPLNDDGLFKQRSFFKQYKSPSNIETHLTQ